MLCCGRSRQSCNRQSRTGDRRENKLKFKRMEKSNIGHQKGRKLFFDKLTNQFSFILNKKGVEQYSLKRTKNRAKNSEYSA